MAARSDISGYLAADHARLERLLDGATAQPDAIDPGPYAEFRRGLLRHIAIEEKLLLPEAQSAGADLPMAPRLRLDHGALAALLVPPPTRAIVATIRAILARHNPIEEGADGLYAACDAVLAGRTAEIVGRMDAYPPVPVSPHNDDPGVMPAVGRALERAGYRLLA